jgi:hypothetical protein
MAVLKKGASLPATSHPMDIPEWEGAVLIRAMSVADLREFQKQSKDDELAAASFAILKSVYDADGQPFFDDIAAVEQLEMGIFRRLSEAVGKLINPDPKAIAKNSEASLN